MSKKTIKDLVEEAGVKLVPIGENIYRGSCPFHINLNTPSFTVYTATDSWFCFGESIGGDIYSFYSRLKNCSYRASKEALDGNVDTLVEITETLDGLSVRDEKDYRDELNFAVSKYCRDLLYKYPSQVDNILKFLQKLDKEYLTKPVSNDILKQVIEESRRLK
jgi:DNA primase